MKYIFMIFRRIGGKPRNLTEYIKNGRWKVTNDSSSIEIKVQQANEDHCGCCNVEELKNDNTDDYYHSFCS